MTKKLIKVMDTSFRDGFQSVYGARVFVDDFYCPVGPMGYFRIGDLVVSA